ncbi:MAG: HD domain-containing phosphohydrolase, partial [Edaphobacter sp.]
SGRYSQFEVLLMLTSSSFRRETRDLGETISLTEVVSALSYALDLTEGAVRGHALRSCLLGMRIGAELRLSSSQSNSLYYALLLKDIAGSSGVGRGGEPGGISLRCDRGAEILYKLGMGEQSAEGVRCLGERWDGGGYPDGLKAEHIPLVARIGAVARHLDLFSVGRSTQSGIDLLRERSGTWFDPELVRVVVSLDRDGALWGQCLAGDRQDELKRAVMDLDPGRTQQGGGGGDRSGLRGVCRCGRCEVSLYVQPLDGGCGGGVLYRRERWAGLGAGADGSSGSVAS